MDFRNLYVETAIGDVASRNTIIPYKELQNAVQNNVGKELYRSMFLYTEEILSHVKEHGSVKGYDGVQALDKITFDIDVTSNNSNKLMEDTNNLIGKLTSKGVKEEYIQIWFSGRGFHVVIPDLYGFKPSKHIAREVKSTLVKDFGNKIDLIYDSKRLIRLPFSLNKKSGLYKNYIPIDFFTNKSYEDIVSLCKSINYNTPIQHSGIVPIWTPVKYSRKEVKKEREIMKNAKYPVNSDVTCGQHIINNGANGVYRHKTLLRLVSIWRRKGFSQDQCILLGRQWIATNPENFSDTEVEKCVIDTFRNGYQYTCQDEILEKFCDDRCKYFGLKNYGLKTEIMNIKQMINVYKEHLIEDKNLSSFNLKDIWKINSDYIFKGGELAVILGDTKLGKTAFVQYLVTQFPDMKTLFMSLEVDKKLIIRRFFQCALSSSKHKINEDLNSLETELKAALSHLTVLCESPDIRKYDELIDLHSPKILVIDTIDAIPAKYFNGEYDRQNFVTNELKALANRHDMIVIAISHISKGASYRLAEGFELDVHSAKGNSVIEQKADKIIAFEGDRNKSNKRSITAIGSRDESSFKLILNFDFNTFNFTQIN
jgi:hypothetical protein|tara:strand:- start:8317 stop:10107 length:1791 start_codon:yes stop_codon:yes gene_type:complete